MDTQSKAVLVAVGWLIIGGGLGVVSASMSLLFGLGGQSSPPWFWGVAILSGMFLIPVVASLGGVPVAYRIWKELPVRNFALRVLAATMSFIVLTWTVIIVWRPKV